MTATITPVSKALVTLPPRAVAGERMMMDGGAAPLKDVIQNLYDRSQHGIDAAAAQLVWSGSYGVDAGGSATVFAVNIPTITSVTLITSGGDAYVHAGGGSAITVTKVEGAPGTLGAVAQWWYVYAFRSGGGSLDFEISTTAPSAGLVFKTGDVTRRYLGCFRTTSAGAPLPVRAHRGRYVYLKQVPATAVTASSSTGYELLSLAGLVPPHSRIALVDVVLTGSANFRSAGDSGSQGASVQAFPLVLDASQRFEWSDGTSGSISANVRGFEE